MMPFPHHGQDHPGFIQTLHGIADFVENVEEETEAEPWEATLDDLPEELQRTLRPDHPIPVTASVRAADSWDGRTYILNPAIGPSYASEPIIRRRPNRVRAIVTNWGPGIVWVAHNTQVAVGEPGSVQIPANGSREFRTRGEVWALPVTANAVVDVQDEYGY